MLPEPSIPTWGKWKTPPEFTELTLADISAHVSELGFQKSIGLCSLVELEKAPNEQFALEDRFMKTFSEDNRGFKFNRSTKNRKK